jgi:hypothetical protein
MIELSFDFLYRQAFVPIKPVPANIQLSGKTALITGASRIP